MIYIGIVEDINDPLKVNRVRVRVFHIHTQDKGLLATEDLKWFPVMMSSSNASVSGIGSSHGLLQGSTVVLQPLDDDLEQFIVLGSLCGIPKEKRDSSLGFSDPDGIYPKAVNITDVPQAALEDYPLNRVYVSEAGHSLQFNDSSNPEVILSHSNGSNISFKSDGSVDIFSSGDHSRTIRGNENLSVDGNNNISISGSVTNHSQGSHVISSGDNLVLKAPRIDLNPNFSVPNPSIREATPVTIQAVREISDNFIVDNSNVSRKKEIKDEAPEGNVCSLDEPTNLYDKCVELSVNEYNEETIDVIFQEMGFAEGTYDGTQYWGAVYLGAMLKRCGYKYLKSADPEAYLKYPSQEDQKEIQSLDDAVKGDIIIFTRSDGYFLGVYSGEKNDEYNEVTVFVGDYEDDAYQVDIIVQGDILIHSIKRPLSCFEQTVTYDGNCTLPKFQRWTPVKDDLLAMALNIYYEAGIETRAGKIAVAHVTMNRYKLRKQHGGYFKYIQGYFNRKKANPTTIWGVVFANKQFSWANRGKTKSWNPASKSLWCECLEIAEKVINGKIPDPTDVGGTGVGALEYWAPSGMLKETNGRRNYPWWRNAAFSKGYKTLKIDTQLFLYHPTDPTPPIP